jgi:hypothetical protein
MTRDHVVLAVCALLLAGVLGWTAASSDASPGMAAAAPLAVPKPALQRRVLSWVDPHLSTRYVFQPPTQ